MLSSQTRMHNTPFGSSFFSNKFSFCVFTFVSFFSRALFFYVSSFLHWCVSFKVLVLESNGYVYNWDWIFFIVSFVYFHFCIEYILATHHFFFDFVYNIWCEWKRLYLAGWLAHRQYVGFHIKCMKFLFAWCGRAGPGWVTHNSFHIFIFSSVRMWAFFFFLLSLF